MCAAAGCTNLGENGEGTKDLINGHSMCTSMAFWSRQDVGWDHRLLDLTGPVLLADRTLPGRLLNVLIQVVPVDSCRCTVLDILRPV